jgi:hypothetical protein
LTGCPGYEDRSVIGNATFPPFADVIRLTSADQPITPHRSAYYRTVPGFTAVSTLSWALDIPGVLVILEFAILDCPDRK